MIVVRDTQKTFCFPFLLTCSICFCQTVSPHIFGTESKLRLCIKKVQLHPPKIIVCWLSMVVRIYRLFANLVRDLLTDWALAEHQIPDSQFGFCPTRNTNQPLFILCHILATAKKDKMKVYTAFLDLFAAYDSVPREKPWRRLQKIKTPQYLRDNIQTMYTGCLYLLIDGDRISEEVAPNRGLKQGCPLSPLLYSLYNNDIDRFLAVQRGAATALDAIKIPHCDYADDIALTSNTAENLQLQLNKFYDYTRFKGLNTDKTKVMVFFSRGNSAVNTFTYDGTPLKIVTHFKYLGFTLTRDGSMHTAADKFRSGIARVYIIGDSKGIKRRKHAMLWLFQVFALKAGLYGCQVWATPSLTYDSSKIIPTHVHLGFLKRLLGVKKSIDTHCVLRKTGQMPISTIGSDASYDSGTVYSLQTILFLRKLCRLTFLLQIEVIH